MEHNTKLIYSRVKNSYQVVMMLEALPIGSAELIFDNNRVVELQSIFVEDQWISRGFGKQFLESILDFCRVQGYYSIHLMTLTNYEHAIQMYEQAGFRVRREFDGCLFMEKKL